MFASVYSALSGLFGFSKGLDVISNNVANMNTPGFKSSQLQFHDLVYQYRLANGDSGNRSALQIGVGVDTTATSVRFNQGEFRDTGNDLDVAVDGNGFFILRDKGSMYYTRAGRFEFDTDGYLIDGANKARVAALDDSGRLSDININGLRTEPPGATDEIRLRGTLIIGSTSHEITDIEVFDSRGETHMLTVQFNKNTTVTEAWDVEILDDQSNSLGTGEVRFQTNGTPMAGYTSISFDYAPPGAASTTIVLDIGDPGSISGVQYLSGAQNTVEVASKNGYAPGSLTKVTFDDAGRLELTYSNEITKTEDALALAWFNNLQNLEQVGGGLFVNRGREVPTVGRSGQNVMGNIQAGKVELSNVELTEQFTDMVIVQRGYQASSQVISTTNEMMQQLMDLKAGR